ncbi:hypothetical protein HUO13_19290 [Saccharopolyspora erythraea]|uniref:YciI family protein n=1 Tax=Saccharopolyspora erythraea TaxID=1836 RepID=UPI001BA7DD54|nr:hypothetical protein [Saccharopolyspora erythraea]QUH02658.1 hypothetical protein HUO13_19290 [Saccharopolyspora erythraea]
MYVVLLHHTVPAEDINLILPDHFEWINRHYRAGDFLIEGRCAPGADSVIIAAGMKRGRLDAILATDPFVLRHMVKPEVIEFRALHTVPELVRYADRLDSGVSGG